MSKGYWITSYRSVSDPTVHSKYAALAGPAITAFGGRFLARGMPSRTFENAPDQRCVVIEFDSVDDAVAAYESPAYQAALALLDGVAQREVRILEGAEEQAPVEAND